MLRRSRVCGEEKGSRDHSLPVPPTRTYICGTLAVRHQLCQRCTGSLQLLLCAAPELGAACRRETVREAPPSPPPTQHQLTCASSALAYRWPCPLAHRADAACSLGGRSRSRKSQGRTAIASRHVLCCCTASTALPTSRWSALTSTPGNRAKQGCILKSREHSHARQSPHSCGLAGPSRGTLGLPRLWKPRLWPDTVP